MTEQARRQELRTPYKQSHPEAGVYRIVNSRNDKVLLGSTPNLASIRNKLEFARSAGSSGVLDWRLREDLRQWCTVLYRHDSGPMCGCVVNDDVHDIGHHTGKPRLQESISL